MAPASSGRAAPGGSRIFMQRCSLRCRCYTQRMRYVSTAAARARAQPDAATAHARDRAARVCVFSSCLGLRHLRFLRLVLCQPVGARSLEARENSMREQTRGAIAGREARSQFRSCLIRRRPVVPSDRR
jgi:hypothetical protein